MAINKEQNKLNVPPLRFPEFHGEWEKCKLGELASEFPMIIKTWRVLESI